MQVQEVNEIVIKVNNLSRYYNVAENEGNYFKYLFCRNYKKVVAVQGISFSINRGECVGFIGPNGAGKSTTIKMLTGILTPSQGEVFVLGRNPQKFRKENAYKIGAVFGQKSQLWWDLPVLDTYILLKKIYRISDKQFKQNLEYYIESLEMESFINRPVRQLSLGQRMRAELCAALLHNPEVLFLDEPTLGLDIVVKKQIREIVRKINHERQVTIILTTHDLKDIEEICNRIIIINNGHIVVDDAIENVVDTFEGYHRVEFKCDETFRNDLNLDGVALWKGDLNKFVAYYHPERISVASIIEYAFKNYQVSDVEIRTPEIEEIIEKYYKDKK